MSRERRIKYDGKTVDFLKPINVHMLEEIQGEIEAMKKEGRVKTEMTLTFDHLLMLRRLLILQDVEMQLCRDNILDGMEFRKSLNE